VPLGVLPPWGSRVVRVRAVVEVERNGKGVEGLLLLCDEAGIQVSAPEVREAARKLEGPVTEAVARFVAERIRPTGYRREARGALWALQHGEGDCTERASLAVALCRARGVPARMVSGYVVRGDGALPVQGWHDWAEAYEDGSWRRLEKREGHFVAFLVHGVEEVLGGARCAAGDLTVEAGK
jgi:transglutaminase-like putative cysteine protease